MLSKSGKEVRTAIAACTLFAVHSTIVFDEAGSVSKAIDNVLDGQSDGKNGLVAAIRRITLKGLLCGICCHSYHPFQSSLSASVNSRGYFGFIGLMVLSEVGCAAG